MTLKIDGGFAPVPGLARPIELDAARLGDEHAADAQRLCTAACAVAPKSGAPQTAPIPDGRRYRLTIEADGSRHEVTAADPIGEPAIAELIAFVEAHGRRGTG
jgi:hypothetical protein